MKRALAISLLWLSACPPGMGPAGGTGGGGAEAGGSAAGGSAGGTAGGAGGGAPMPGDGGVEGVELLGRLAGLWSGPATMTRLGNFPQMSFDLRPVGDGFVFGQTELDGANTLRFGLNIETHGGRDVLAYRNGGFFTGVLRDSRTALVESGPDTWRFCSVTPQGCGYIDARFTLNGTNLVVDARVRGMPHMYWNAQRRETRTVPAPFPASLASQGDGSAPWPAMGSLRVNASWLGALAQPADVWLLLTTTACLPSFACSPSRSVSAAVASGTTVTLTLPSVHAGSYKATVLVDLDRNFASVLRPSSGDRLAVDLDVTVAASGEVTLAAPANLTVP